MFLDATTGPWERVPHAVHGSFTLRHRRVLLLAYTETIVAQVHRGEHNRTQVACPRWCGAAQLVTEVPYDTAQTLFRELTGVPFGSERMHTVTNHMAQELMVLDVA